MARLCRKVAAGPAKIENRRASPSSKPPGLSAATSRPITWPAESSGATRIDSRSIFSTTSRNKWLSVRAALLTNERPVSSSVMPRWPGWMTNDKPRTRASSMPCTGTAGSIVWRIGS